MRFDRRRETPCSVRYLGGTRVEFTCKAAGHAWTEDLAAKDAAFHHVRFSESAVKVLAGWWERGGGCTAACRKCQAEQGRTDPHGQSSPARMPARNRPIRKL